MSYSTRATRKRDLSNYTTVHRRVYESLTAFLDTATGKPVAPITDKDRSSRAHYSDWDWTRGVNFEEAVDMAAHEGWAEQVKTVQAFSAEVRDKVLSEATIDGFAWYHDAAGALVDIGRAVTGDPESMIEYRTQPVQTIGMTVRIVVPVGLSWDVPESLVAQRGAAIVALADCLYALNHPMEIWVCYANTRGFDRQVCAVKVQRGDQPLHIGRVMFATAHSAFPRRLGFSHSEATMPHELRRQWGATKSTGGYGSPPRDVSEDDLPPASHDTTLTLPELVRSADWSVKASTDWILRTLEDLGH